MKDILVKFSRDESDPQKNEENINGKVAAVMEQIVPLLRVNVTLELDVLSFSPDLDSFNEVIESVISGFIDTVVSIPKLISYVSFDEKFLSAENFLAGFQAVYAADYQ